MNITVLYNTPTDRFLKSSLNKEAEDDTYLSAKEVAAVVGGKLVSINEHTIEKTIASIEADLVFNLIEWTGIDTPYAKKTYEEMDKRNIVYTGATWESYYLSCDKIALKKQLDAFGFPTSPWQAFVTGDEKIRSDFHYPVILKVSLEHSSVGLSKDAVFNSEHGLSAFIKKQLHEFAQPVFVEEFLEGREFQVTLLEIAGGLQVLPPAEIVYEKNIDVPLLTYESRWNEHSSDYENSQVIIPKKNTVIDDIMKLCRSAFIKLGFRDYVRFDIRCRENMPFFLELNSNPGLGDDDEYAMTLSYKAAGMTFADVVWNIVEAARRRTS